MKHWILSLTTTTTINISNLSEFFKKVSIILYGKKKRKKEKKKHMVDRDLQDIKWNTMSETYDLYS